MGYQSKTYSLSDEVVEAIEAARARGETPNQLLRRVLLRISEEPRSMSSAQREPHTTYVTPRERELVVELDGET